MSRFISWIEGKASLCLLLILTAALILRLHNIAASSLWLDELITVFYSNWEALFQNTDQTLKLITHPLGYHLFMSAWLFVFGKSELALRMPSTLFDLASIAMLFLIAKRLQWRASAALAMCAIYSVAYTPVYFAQEARPYSLMIFLALSLLFQSLSEGKPNWLRFFLQTLTALALTQVHFFGILGVVGILVTCVLISGFNKGRWIHYGSTLVICLLSLVPLFPYMLEHVNTGQHWILPANYDAYKDYILYFIFGSDNYDWAFHTFTLTAVCALLFGQRQNFSWIAGLLIWFFSGILFCSVYEYLFSPIFIRRYLILGFPAALLLLGSFFHSLASKRPKIFVFCASFCFLAFAWGTYSSSYFQLPQKSSLREAFEAIQQYEVTSQVQIPIYACGYQSKYLDYYSEAIIGRKIPVPWLCNQENLKRIPERPLLLIWYYVPMDYRMGFSDIMIEKTVLFEKLDTKVLLIDRCCH